MRQIKPPHDVDSLGKLKEWLAECGMPQRDILPEEIGSEPCTEAEQFGLGTRFLTHDQDAANAGHRELITFVAQAFYARFSHMDGKTLVWRVRPEISEEPECRYENHLGEPVDVITHRDDGYPLSCIPLGTTVVKCYARFWLEEEISKPPRPPMHTSMGGYALGGKER